MQEANNTKETMYLVSKGEIKDASIQIKCDGEKMTLTGRDAKLFALGCLVGMRKEAVTSVIQIEENEG